MLPKDDKLSLTITNLKVNRTAILIYFTCDLLKPVETGSAGVGLFLIPVQTDSAGDPC